MHNHVLSPFPPLSLSLLYHDNFRIACRFIYIFFCYLTTSSYCCINCEYFIFYTCLTPARYYISITTCHILIMANHNSFIHNTGLNENNSLTHLLDTISPDMEDESNIIEQSKYYDDADFKDALQQYNVNVSVLSLNCQSINAKYDKLKLFLDVVNTHNPISIICIQESWCHDEIDINCFSLPNYTLINSYRRLTAHGGLIMYVHDDFAFNEINENLPITHTSTLFESLFVEVWRKNIIYKKYVIGNIYRLPSYISDDVKSFINEFTALLNGLSMRSKSVYLCGDYNIDLLKIHPVEDYS